MAKGREGLLLCNALVEANVFLVPDVLETAAEPTQRTLAGLTPSDMELQTPCEDFTVAALIEP